MLGCTLLLLLLLQQVALNPVQESVQELEGIFK
jgi:hypothetical protein